MSTDHTSDAVADFPAEFRGAVHRPGEAGFISARQIWNMRRDGDQPALIVQPLDVEDVVAAVRYAVRRNISIAVHSGGHGIDGTAMPDGALVIDNSRLKSITIDPATARVTIEAGVRLGELDAATQEHGLVVPAGVVTDTGAAGLTLGGGIGHNTRRFGATVDHVVSIEIVTADGRVVTASADHEPELFWGLLGAGHNLGIATSFTYQAHKLGPQVMSGLVIFGADDAPNVFENVDEVMAHSPRELAVALLVMLAPPLPGLPEHVRGTPILGALVVYTGELDSYQSAVSGFLGMATPLVDMVAPCSWLEANSFVDRFEPPGRRRHMIGGYLPKLNAEIATIAIDAIARSPRPKNRLPACLITLPILGGALFDRDEDSTAFSRAGAEWIIEVASSWDEGADDATYAPWADETFALLESRLASNAYVNLTSDRGPAWLRQAYGSAEKWERIVALKRAWDPDNRLSYNKNVTRAVEERN